MRLAHQTLLPVHESARRTPRLQAKLLLLRTNPLARRSVLQAKGMIAPFVMRTCIMNPPTTSIGVRDVEIQSIRHALRPVRRNIYSGTLLTQNRITGAEQKRKEGVQVTCVWCRSPWIVPGPKGSGSGLVRTNSRGYINLSGVAGLSPVRDASTCRLALNLILQFTHKTLRLPWSAQRRALLWLSRL